MQTITLEPLRWSEQPARVTIVNGDGHPKAYLQITSPREIARMAKGRPVEEVPRMVGILSPAHHLVSAMALDKLFAVEPPDMAVNMREGFLQAQFVRHHLRKLYFLLSSEVNPFQGYRMREASEALGSQLPAQALDEIMDCLALAQEAATILGGRADHPMSAVPGGVGRFLKDPHYPRLADIAAECVNCATRVAKLLREKILQGSAAMAALQEMRFNPMPSITANGENGNAILRNAEGKEIEQIPADKVFEKIGLHHEAWTREPFAFLKDKGWSSVEAEDSGSLYFVGPLARLNAGEELPTPLAEEERQLLVGDLGPFPHFSVAAAFRALAVEAIAAAEKMVELCSQEKLTGPAIRTMPSQVGSAGWAALESPQGFIAHRYTANEQGILQEIEILDSTAENNALLCSIVRKAVEDSYTRKQGTEGTKSSIEVSLLPF